jgi:hypothetical protein
MKTMSAIVLATVILESHYSHAAVIIEPNCTFLASTLLDLSLDSGLVLEHYRCDGTWLVSLQRLVSIDDKGYPTWKLLDTIRVRNVQRFEEIEDSTCSRDDIFDGDLVALGLRTSPHEIRNVRKAWKVNRVSGRFMEVSPTGITCEPYFPGGHENEWYELRRRQTE